MNDIETIAALAREIVAELDRLRAAHPNTDEFALIDEWAIARDGLFGPDGVLTTLLAGAVLPAAEEQVRSAAGSPQRSAA